MKKTFLLFSFFLVAFISLAQTSGVVTGKIVDEITGEELVGVVVGIEELGTGATTDLFGTYTIKNVPAGSYTLIVQYISYQSKRITGVVVQSAKTTTQDILMNAATVETGVVEIVDSRVTNSEAAVLMEMKEAKGVLSGLSAAQIAKSQDRDASEVARRVPGVTVVDNRFVIVRGLSERYNAVMVNNALAPSMESDVKSFSFDIIPSGLIDRFLIYKSPSADLPGEFSGGAIKVFTRNMPSRNFEVSVNQLFGYRAGTTFDNFRFSHRGKTDWLGYDDGSRRLPDNFPSNVRQLSPDEKQTLGKSLPNTWNDQSETAPLDTRTSVSIAKKWKKDKHEFGIVGAVNYSRTRTTFLSEVGVYNVYDVFANASDTVTYFRDSTFQTQTRVGFLLNLGYRTKNHKIELRSFTNQTAQTEDIFRTGIDYEASNNRREYFFNFNQRIISTSQLSGQHDVFKSKGVVEWVAGLSYAGSSDPDWRRIRYTQSLDDLNSPYSAYLPASADPNYFGRLFLDLSERIPMFAGSYEHKIYKMADDLAGKEQFITAKAGFYFEDKTRDFRIRNIGYKPASFQTYGNFDLLTNPISQILDPSNVNNVNGFQLDEDTKPQDAYTAGNNLKAGFVKLTLPLKRLTIDGGVRAESNRQTLNTRNLQNKEYDIIKDSLVFLPSVNIAYNFSSQSLIRFAAGKTINRPEFRELAPFSFYDYKRNAIMSGNPDLKFATINNYDLRWELYPATGEMFSIGAFYKEFTNPIELYFQPGVGSGGTLSFIPGNAKAATNFGFELDIRKKLNSLSNVSLIKDITFVANASIIKSEIKLSDSASETGVDANRPMMGQSPYIINTGIYYQNDSLDLSISLMYNVVGSRVVVVGVPGVPEVYEMPRNLIDLSVSKGIGKNFDIRFGIQDMLNQPVLWLQDANEDGKINRDNDQVYNKFRRGTYFTFGVSYSFKED